MIRLASIASAASPQVREMTARAASNATPMMRVVSGSNRWPSRKGVIGMAPPTWGEPIPQMSRVVCALADLTQQPVVMGLANIDPQFSTNGRRLWGDRLPVFSRTSAQIELGVHEQR